jgi:hypothetical protein
VRVCWYPRGTLSVTVTSYVPCLIARTTQSVAHSLIDKQHLNTQCSWELMRFIVELWQNKCTNTRKW